MSNSKYDRAQKLLTPVERAVIEAGDHKLANILKHFRRSYRRGDIRLRDGWSLNDYLTAVRDMLQQHPPELDDLFRLKREEFSEQDFTDVVDTYTLKEPLVRC